MSDIVRLYRSMTRWPGGSWLFSRAVCWRAPYFDSIAPRIDVLEPGRCMVYFADRRRVRNHLGTVHAIALCNAAELAGGLATEASLGEGLRWIPKGMQVRYLKKARGPMTVTAHVPVTGTLGSDGGCDLVAAVTATDASGETVFAADITMWISQRR